MPVHYTGPSTPAGSADPWAELAKAFMSNGAFARNYVQEAQRAAPRTHEPGDGFYGSGNPYPMSMSDRDLIAGILTAEGGNPTDMGYIADVIQNRAASGSYPMSYRDVIMQPGQFSALNRVTGYAGGSGGNDLWMNPTADAYDVTDRLLSGNWTPLTGGALNYYQPQLSNPSWGGPHFRALPGSSHVFGTA